MNNPPPMTAIQLQQTLPNLGVPDQATMIVWTTFERELDQGNCNVPVLLMDFAHHIGADNVQKMVLLYSAMIEMEAQVVAEASGNRLTIEAIRCPEILTMHWPQTKALKGTSKEPHVPRPMNPWVLFRRFEYKTHPEKYSHMPLSQQSIEIGKVWKHLSAEAKDEWKQLSKEEALRHKTLHPNYQFSPRKPSQIKRRLGPKKREALAAAAAHGEQSAETSSDANNFPTPGPGSIDTAPHSEIHMTSSGNAVIDLGDRNMGDEELRTYLTNYNNFISNRPNQPINFDAINLTPLHSEPTKASLSQKVFYETCAGFNVGDTTWEDFMEEGAFA